MHVPRPGRMRHRDPGARIGGAPMTPRGTPSTAARVDVDHIRRTYGSVLGDPRLGRPHLTDEQRAHLAGLLRGHMWLLVPEAERRLPNMLGSFNRSAAQYVIAQARSALGAPIRGASSADQVYDLATLCRALLALYQQTEPVGPAPQETSSDSVPDATSVVGGVCRACTPKSTS
ncbi:DUF6415 family natural product biosynthesis protein [Streptomyces sp. NPDC001450]